MIETVLTLVLAAAVAIERVVEVIKPLYLKVKRLFTKRDDIECTKTEKIVISVFAGPILCIVGGVKFDIPELSVIAQQVLIGLFASIGSNAIHALLSIVLAFKNGAEGLKKSKFE